MSFAPGFQSFNGRKILLALDTWVWKFRNLNIPKRSKMPTWIRWARFKRDLFSEGVRVCPTKFQEGSDMSACLTGGRSHFTAATGLVHLFWGLVAYCNTIAEVVTIQHSSGCNLQSHASLRATDTLHHVVELNCSCRDDISLGNLILWQLLVSLCLRLRRF